MPEDKKTRILFLFPGPIYQPDLPNFKDRFEMLSEYFEGEIYSWSCNPQFKEYVIGSFFYRGLIGQSKGLKGKWQLACHMVRCARQYHKKKKADVIVCYDPMFTGVIGSFLKLITWAKLIVEVNSERYDGALMAFYGKSISIRIKTILFKILCYWALSCVDGIKVLTESTRLSLPMSFQKKRMFVFHGFVPTHYFQGGRTVQKKILFVGHPFCLKGVDILIKAFNLIQEKYPEFTLCMIGHRLEEDADSCFHHEELDGRKIFQKGMFYGELKEHFLNCYCAVLPSRTEGMGRVLIEAMASGKPVIGSNVGGIPSVIEDGRNGFLFESENIDDLADKLDRLLSDPELARRMGDESRKIIDEKFSSQKYVEHFKKMIDEIVNGK